MIWRKCPAEQSWAISGFARQYQYQYCFCGQRSVNTNININIASDIAFQYQYQYYWYWMLVNIQYQYSRMWQCNININTNIYKNGLAIPIPISILNKWFFKTNFNINSTNIGNNIDISNILDNILATVTSLSLKRDWFYYHINENLLSDVRPIHSFC